MSTTTQEFETIFFEEMSEHLDEMESLLLEMSDNADESSMLEALEAIFRVVHSIKGGASIFGFDKISTLTHRLENLLDKLRVGQIKLQQAMVDTFLQSRDILDALKVAYQSNDHQGVSEKILQELCTTLDGYSSDPVPSFSKSPTSDSSADTTIKPLTVGQKLSLKILLVEDSKVVQKVACHTLNKLGYGLVEVAENGQLALDKLNASLDDPFQIVLLDCQMPILDGYQATDKIRAGKAGKEHQAIAIIAMTAMAGDEEQQKCLNAGMNDYLVKPIKAELVDNKIAYWYSKLTEDRNQESNVKPKDQTGAVQPSQMSKRKAIVKSHEASSIRVSTEKVDLLINQVGELIITQSMLQNLTCDLGLDSNTLLTARLNQLEANTRDLQATVMSVRMMPIGTVFGRFPRIVRDLSNSLDKSIKLVIEGEQTQLDKGLLELLVDPLTHIVRNSIDHGIELPSQRKEQGKPEQGTIVLSAVYRGGNVIVHIEDDGAGIDPMAVQAKAKKNGMVLPKQMSKQDIYQLIFSAGFSTAAQVTEVSGRGVGMDVVKRNIAKMGGTVSIDSALGVGTQISIQLPFTLAILEGMTISVGEHVYVIPLSNIVESLQPKAANLKLLNGGEVMIKVQEEYIPIVRLHKLFGIDTDITDICDGIVVLLEHGSKVIALFVDSLIGQQQVVVKSLEQNFKKVPCVSGATIMGDGRVSLILDVAGLVNLRQ